MDGMPGLSMSLTVSVTCSRLTSFVYPPTSLTPHSDVRMSALHSELLPVLSKPSTATLTCFAPPSTR